MAQSCKDAGIATDAAGILCHRQSNNPQMWQSNIPHPSHARSIRWNRKIDINSLKSLPRRGGNPD